MNILIYLEIFILNTVLNTVYSVLVVYKQYLRAEQYNLNNSNTSNKNHNLYLSTKIWEEVPDDRGGRPPL